MTEGCRCGAVYWVPAPLPAFSFIPTRNDFQLSMFQCVCLSSTCCVARAASWLSVRVSHRSDPEERSEPSHRTFPCLTHVKRESTLCWSISKAGGLKVRDASLKIILLHWARKCYKCCVYCSKSHFSCKPSCSVCMSSIYIPYAHCIVCYNLKMGSDSCVGIRSVSNYFTHRFLLCDFTKHLIRRAECVMPDGLLYWKYFEFFHAWSVFSASDPLIRELTVFLVEVIGHHQRSCCFKPPS